MTERPGDSQQQPSMGADKNGERGGADQKKAPEGVQASQVLFSEQDLTEASKQISKRYELGEQLGAGGFSIGFRALDKKLKRPVFIKLINFGSETEGEEFASKNFNHEVENTAKVRHRNVIEIFECGELGSVGWLVLELLDGCDLEEYSRTLRAPLTNGESSSSAAKGWQQFTRRYVCTGI